MMRLRNAQYNTFTECIVKNKNKNKNLPKEIKETNREKKYKNEIKKKPNIYPVDDNFVFESSSPPVGGVTISSYMLSEIRKNNQIRTSYDTLRINQLKRDKKQEKYAETNLKMAKRNKKFKR